MADDYERQFQADLERAAALSMETLALEEFKRKQRNSGGSVQRSSRNSMTGDQLNFHRATSSAPQDLSRRRSEVLHSSATAPDLISFSGPDPNPVDLMSTSQGGASGQTPVQDKHTSFVQYVGQIHQISTQQQQYLAGVRTANAAITPFTPIPVAGPDGMQLMPYRPAATPTTQPLTPDNLQKLYNSAYYPTGYSRFPSQFITTPQAVVPLANVPYATAQQQMRSASVPPSIPGSSAGTMHSANYSQYDLGQASTPGIGLVNNPESALVPVASQPTMLLTPSTATYGQSNGSGPSLTSRYSVAPSLRRPSEKGPSDDLIDLESLGQSLDKVSVLEAFDPLMNNELYNDKGKRRWF